MRRAGERGQVPAILGDVEDPVAATIGGVTCLAALAAYCVYQVGAPPPSPPAPPTSAPRPVPGCHRMYARTPLTQRQCAGAASESVRAVSVQEWLNLRLLRTVTPAPAIGRASARTNTSLSARLCTAQSRIEEALFSRAVG